MTEADKKRKDQRKFTENEDKQADIDAQALDQFTVLQDAPKVNLHAEEVPQTQRVSPLEDVASSGNLNYQIVEKPPEGGVQDLVGDKGVENPGLESLAGGGMRGFQVSTLEAVAGDNFDTIISEEDEALASAFGTQDELSQGNWCDILDTNSWSQGADPQDIASGGSARAGENDWHNLLEGGEDLISGSDVLDSGHDLGTDGGFG